jgi:hypothetical protein
MMVALPFSARTLHSSMTGPPAFAHHRQRRLDFLQYPQPAAQRQNWPQ